MKQLLCIFSIIFILVSCKSSNQVEEIEMLTYYSNAKDFEIYSTTSNNGFTQTLSKSRTSKQYVDNYQSRIRKSLIDSILKVCKKANDQSFKFKASKKMWYCGYWHTVQITYENGKKIRFKYPFANNENKQFIPFQSLFHQIIKDSLRAARLNIGQIGGLYIKQEELSKITFKEDSIWAREYRERHK